MSCCARGSCSCAAIDANIDTADLNINTALQNCGDRRPSGCSEALARSATLLPSTRAMVSGGREEGGSVEAARSKLIAG